MWMKSVKNESLKGALNDREWEWRSAGDNCRFRFISRISTGCFQSFHLLICLFFEQFYLKWYFPFISCKGKINSLFFFRISKPTSVCVMNNLWFLVSWQDDTNFSAKWVTLESTFANCDLSCNSDIKTPFTTELCCKASEFDISNLSVINTAFWKLVQFL